MALPLLHKLTIVISLGLLRQTYKQSSDLKSTTFHWKCSLLHLSGTIIFSHNIMKVPCVYDYRLLWFYLFWSVERSVIRYGVPRNGFPRVPFSRNEGTPPFYFESAELEPELVTFLVQRKKRRSFFFR